MIYLTPQQARELGDWVEPGPAMAIVRLEVAYDGILCVSQGDSYATIAHDGTVLDES
jgi:hypothetical protein